MNTFPNPENAPLDAELKFRLLVKEKAELLARAKVAGRSLSHMGRKAIQEFLLQQRVLKTSTRETPTTTKASPQTDFDTLFFPTEIATIIGMSSTEINALKKRGCKFLGRKTKIRWVREWIDKEVEGE